MIPQQEITALSALIERMESATPLSPVDIFYKARDRRPNFLKDTRAEILQKEEALQSLTKVEMRSKHHPIHGDTHFALGYQVSRFICYFEDWLASAHTIPPYHANRILTILKRAKLLELRAMFIAACDRHSLQPMPHVIPLPPPSDMAVPRLSVTLSTIERLDQPGSFYVSFQFCCLECGGFVLHLPDDDDEDGPAVCKACGIVFGSYGQVRALCQRMAENAVSPNLAAASP